MKWHDSQQSDRSSSGLLSETAHTHLRVEPAYTQEESELKRLTDNGTNKTRMRRNLTCKNVLSEISEIVVSYWQQHAMNYA